MQRSTQQPNHATNEYCRGRTECSSAERPTISLDVEALEKRIAPMMPLIVAEAAAGSTSRGVTMPCDCLGPGA